MTSPLGRHAAIARPLPSDPASRGRTVERPLAPGREWIDKLEIRDLIERSMRYIDDKAGARFAALFDEGGVLQLAGTVFSGRSCHSGDVRGSRPTPLVRAGPAAQAAGCLASQLESDHRH